MSSFWYFFRSSDYKEYHTDVSVKFIVSLTAQQLNKAEEEGLHKKFKLETPWSATNIVSSCFLKRKQLLRKENLPLNVSKTYPNSDLFAS